MCVCVCERERVKERQVGIKKGRKIICDKKIKINKVKETERERNDTKMEYKR